MWIRTDHCPTCDAPIDVYVPQPYASGPELLEALEFAEADPCFKTLGSVTHDNVRAAIAKATT